MSSENGEPLPHAAAQQILLLVQQMQETLLGLPGELPFTEKITRIADHLIRQYGLEKARAVATVFDRELSSNVSREVLAELDRRAIYPPQRTEPS